MLSEPSLTAYEFLHRPPCRPRAASRGWRRGWASRAVALWLAAVGLATAVSTAAQSEAPVPLSAVVGVTATVPPGARTAAILGTERSGSGVVIDGGGLVLTVGYLILEATQVQVRQGERSVPADVIAYDHDTGLGLLRAREALTGVRPAPLGRSSGAGVRTPVVVAAAGGESPVRPAFIVDRRDFAGYWEYLIRDAIYTSPPHPGFGGAGLFDVNGQLVGIGSLAVADAIGAQRPLAGNLFIPIDALKPILGELLAVDDATRQQRPWMGLYAQPIGPRLVVARVASEGPAEQAGMRRGDIVLGVGEQPVTGLADFYQRVWALGPAGVTVPLTVLRGGELLRIELRSVSRQSWLTAAAGGS